MHTRASNSELVEPLPEPERTLNRRLRRRNIRVPFDQRNNPPQHSRIVHTPILGINYFCHFLVTLENLYPMDDEPMWAADRVVAPTPGFAITIPETTNEFAIKALFDRILGEIRAFAQHENESLTDAWLLMKEMLRNNHGHNLSKGNIIKIFYHGLIEITQEVLNAVAGAKNQKTKSSLKKTVAFADEGNNNSNTDKIMARMDAMTIKMDAQYKELQSRANKSTLDLNEDDMPMSREEEAKFMQTFCKTCFYNDYRDRDSNRDNWRSSERNSYNRDSYRSNTDDKSYDLQKQFNDFMKSQQSTNAFVKDTFMDPKTQLETLAKNHQASIQNLETKFDRLVDKQSGRPFGSLLSNTQPNLKGSKAYQPPQSRNEHVNAVFTRSEPPTDLELKPLPDDLEYVFLEEPSFLPIIISSQLSAQNKSKLIYVLKRHKEAFAWKTTDIPGICPSFSKHKIQLLDDKKPVVQKQRRLNPNMQEVVKKEIMKLLDTGIIYLIADSPWVSPIHCVPGNIY
ncbi:hypothetical protein Tco_0929945 [Tanacetum coccineum]